MENKRINSLLKILLTEDNPVPIAVLAKRIGASNNTIRKDLNIIEHILLLNGCILVKSRGIGIYIDGSRKEKLELLAKLQVKNDEDIQIHSQGYRIYYILRRLLLNTDSYIKVDDLSEELFVSRSTVQNDLLKCKKWLTGFSCKIEIKRKTGFKVVGSELNCRKALCNLIDMESKNNKSPNENELNRRRLKKEIYNEIKNVLDMDCSPIERIIHNAEKRLCLSLDDKSYSFLVMYIAVTVKRVQGSYEITNGIKIEEHKESREYKVAVMMAKEIEAKYNIRLGMQEVYYLFLYIASAKYMKSSIKKVKFKLDKVDKLCISIAKEIISITERVYGQNFKEDNDFYEGLLIHLRPTIYRLMLGITFGNPLLKEIKDNYPKAYGIAYASNEVFEKFLGKPIPEEEIGYIAIHIEAAAERKKDLLNAVVVCNTGMGTAELLATKIRKRFKQINIVRVESFSAFSESENDDIDLVFSTIPIETKIPHLLVSPLLTIDDLNSIFNFIEKGDSYEKRLHDFIDRALFYEYQNCKNKEEVIYKVSGECESKGYVTSKYYDGVIRREKCYSTEIGKGVAVPHSPLEYVKKSIMVLVKLDKPVKWDTTKVDIVLFVAINKEDSYDLTEFLKNIYSCFDDDVFLEELRRENDEEKIKETLYEKCIEF